MQKRTKIIMANRNMEHRRVCDLITDDNREPVIEFKQGRRVDRYDWTEFQGNIERMITRYNSMKIS